jgi:hypothetical protein
MVCVKRRKNSRWRMEPGREARGSHGVLHHLLGCLGVHGGEGGDAAQVAQQRPGRDAARVPGKGGALRQAHVGDARGRADDEERASGAGAVGDKLPERRVLGVL